jgi:hypothetical protein
MEAEDFRGMKMQVLVWWVSQHRKPQSKYDMRAISLRLAQLHLAVTAYDNQSSEMLCLMLL